MVDIINGLIYSYGPVSAIYRYISEGGDVGTKDIVKMMGIDRSSVRYYTNKLSKYGLIDIRFVKTPNSAKYRRFSLGRLGKMINPDDVECIAGITSFEQFSILEYIYKHGAVKTDEIIKAVGITKGSSNAILNKLIRNGYLYCEWIEGKRSKRVYSITKRGRDAITKIYRDFPEFEPKSYKQKYLPNGMRRMGINTIYELRDMIFIYNNDCVSANDIVNALGYPGKRQVTKRLARLVERRLLMCMKERDKMLISLTDMGRKAIEAKRKIEIATKYDIEHLNSKLLELLKKKSISGKTTELYETELVDIFSSCNIDPKDSPSVKEFLIKYMNWDALFAERGGKWVSVYRKL